jgi:hypothetical protein
MNRLHASNEFLSKLMNVVAHCHTVGPAGGDAGEKAKIQSVTEGQLNAIDLKR